MGDVVAVEKPVVSHILPEYMGKNCSHCFKTMKAPMPCFYSTKVMVMMSFLKFMIVSR